MTQKFRVLLLPMILLVMCSFSLTACGLTVPGDSAGKTKDKEKISIAIRNDTETGGFAAQTGVALKEDGFTFENGYTINIGNTRVESYSRSFVWIPKGNAALKGEASTLADSLGLKVVANDDTIGDAEGVEDSILIVLGKDLVQAGLHNDIPMSQLSDIPTIPANSATILQIEPLDVRAADAIKAEQEADRTRKPGESFHIKVLNACGIEGAASRMSQCLDGLGYETALGSAQSGWLDSTWIIYNGEEFRAEAETIRNDLGTGDLKDGSDWGYIHDDIVIQVGLDWVNTNMLSEGQEPYPSLYTTPLQ